MIKIIPREKREILLHKTSHDDFIRYFDYLEQLSDKKGGIYSNILIEDKEYVQNGGMFTNAIRRREDPADILRKKMGVSGEYICPFRDYKQGACNIRRDRLSDLQRVLEDDHSGRANTEMWRWKIVEFIEFLMCCPIRFRNNRVFEVYALPIVDIIKNNYKFLQYAVKTINIILDKFPEKYNDEMESINNHYARHNIHKYRRELSDAQDKDGYEKTYRSIIINIFIDKLAKYNNLLIPTE